MMYRKWIYWFSFVLMFALTGHLFAQLTFPVPEATPGIPEGESIAYQTMESPTINGDLSDWIDAGAVFKYIGADDNSDVLRGDWEGPEDSSFLWSMMWDDDSLYFAASIVDDIYTPIEEIGSWWQGDCIILYIDADADDAVDNKMAALRLDWEEPTVVSLSGVGAGGVNLAIMSNEKLEEGRFVEFSIPVDSMANMTPVSGEYFGIQVGLEEGSGEEDAGKFLCWAGLNPDTEGNLFPVTFAGPVSVSQSTTHDIPSNYILEQNYPNPFNPSTDISFSVPKQTRVRLAIYDLLGKEIATLVDEEKPAGAYTVAFDAHDLNSGVYFYKMTCEHQTVMKKMTLVK